MYKTCLNVVIILQSHIQFQSKGILDIIYIHYAGNKPRATTFTPSALSQGSHRLEGIFFRDFSMTMS